MSDDLGWEARMAARHAERRATKRRSVEGDPMAPWRRADDPEGILPEILAARCLGIEYGDPGPVLGGEWCRECWGERHVWLGNCWGLQHMGGTMSGCQHSCHEGQVWLAAAAS